MNGVCRGLAVVKVALEGCRIGIGNLFLLKVKRMCSPIVIRNPTNMEKICKSLKSIFYKVTKKWLKKC